ncbi:hypothetical protein [Sporosarcina sp. Marseille-Q4943]|uniref:YkoP family protein n=1 Tax=Sporosarcina sp. Marseille-Q4943 TaxID=2942204 RepID=UPI00208DC7B2|nr:hypothetical protein [Sporosarcina sp. Marseille-Q4943]
MKRQIINIWSLIDPFYLKCTRLQCLEQIIGKYNIFRIRLTRYKGREVVLSDGTVIQKNDLLVKIHLHNVRVLKEMDSMDGKLKILFLYKAAYYSMPALALYVLQHEQRDHIKGIIGITMIEKGYDRLGFESFTFSSSMYTLFKRISLYPIHLLANSKSSSKRKKTPVPRYLFMSKDSLSNKYGSLHRNIA